MRMFLPVACAGLVACGGTSPTTPSQQPVRLTASITNGVIPAGQIATITFRLENTGSDTITLHFNDSCQVMPYISSGSGSVVYPPGSGWFCAAGLTSLTLRPGESQTRELKVGGVGQPLDSYVGLATGDYSAYARVPSSEYSLRSDPVRFTIQ